MTPRSLDPANELWQGLGAEQARRVGEMFVSRAFDAGETFIRQGEAAQQVIFIDQGEVEVIRELPGGGVVALDTMGPGAVLGEIGLLVDSPRLASVRAKTPVKAGLLSIARFRAACDGLEPALLIVARNILRIMSDRLMQQTERVLAEPAGRVLSPPAAGAPVTAPSRPSDSFHWREFVSILPSFCQFGPTELATFLERVRPLDVAKGGIIAPAGAPLAYACFVLRGAAAGLYASNGGRHILNILGPGELCGASDLILTNPAQLDYVAREACVLLQLPAADFHDLIGGNDALGLALIGATALSLSTGFRRSNNTLGNLTRLALATA